MNDNRERVFPSALEMERCMLGAAIMAPEQIDECRDIVQPTDFYRPDHAALWLMLVLMRNAGDPIDLVNVVERAHRGGKDDEVGGLAYLITHVEMTPSTANIAHYARNIAEKARLRRLIAALQEAEMWAFEESKDCDQIMAQLSVTLDGVASGRNSADDWQDWSDAIDNSVNRVRDAIDGKPLSGYPVHLAALAKIVERLEPGQVVVVAARPAMGKTSLAMGFARAIAQTGDIVGVFSLEMTGDQLAMGDLARTTRRVVADEQAMPIGALTGFSARDLAAGRIGDADWRHVQTAAEIAAALPIKVSRKKTVTIADIEADVRKLVRAAKARDRKVGAIVIDYLQLITMSGGNANKADKIGDVTRAIKNLALSQGVVIILLSQLNRQCEQRDDKRPRVPDLRDSGTIEQDADLIIFCYRDIVYNPDGDPHAAELGVAKQRNGMTGVADVRWSGESTEFYDEATETHKLGGYEDFMRTGGL